MDAVHERLPVGSWSLVVAGISSATEGHPGGAGAVERRQPSGTPRPAPVPDTLSQTHATPTTKSTAVADRQPRPMCTDDAAKTVPKGVALSPPARCGGRASRIKAAPVGDHERSRRGSQWFHGANHA